MKRVQGGFLIREAAVLFFVNLCAGLFFINEGLFHYDSVILARAVEVTLQTGQLQAAVSGRYGSVIVNAMLYVPFFFFGENADFVTRFSSVLFHALSIAALYLFIIEFLRNRSVAFFTALLFSITPLYFIPNTYGKEHGMAMFFLLYAFYLLLRGCRENSRWLIGIASFFCGVSVAVRESMIFMVPLFLVLFFRPRPSMGLNGPDGPGKRPDTRDLVALIVPLLVVLGVLFFSYLGEVFYRTLFVQGEDVASFDGLLSPILSLAFSDIFEMVSLLGIVCFVTGMIRMLFKEGLFITCFLIAWFMSILFYGNNSCYSARYLDLVMVPVWIGTVYGIVELSSRSRIFIVFLTGVLVSGMLVLMYPLLDLRRDYNGEKRFAEYVGAVTEEDAIILCMDDSPFISYYGKRRVLVGQNSGDMELFIKKITMYLMQGVPVYCIGSFFQYDDKGVLRAAIERNFDRQKVGGFLKEDFHRPEYEFQMYFDELYKLSLKQELQGSGGRYSP